MHATPPFRIPRRTLWLSCLLTLACSHAWAQEPPDPGADQADNIRRTLVQRGFFPGPPPGVQMPIPPGNPSQKIAELEAKIDTLLWEVRELRRETQSTTHGPSAKSRHGSRPLQARRTGNGWTRSATSIRSG